MKVSSLTPADRRVLEITEIPVWPLKRLWPNVIKWNRLAAGWVKLNMDGSCRGNPGNSGGGGVIRDAEGNFLAGFWKLMVLALNWKQRCELGLVECDSVLLWGTRSLRLRVILLCLLTG